MPENTEWCPQDADGKGLNLRILYPAIVSFISKGHGELFSDKQELRIHGMHGGYSPPLYTYKALLSSLLPLPLQPLPLSPLHGAHYTTARPLSLHSAHSPSCPCTKPFHMPFSLTAHGQLLLTLQGTFRCSSPEGDGFASLYIIHTNTHSTHEHTWACTNIHTTRSSTRAGIYLVILSITSPLPSRTGSGTELVDSTYTIISSIQSQSDLN